jgi:diaminopimelate epimerase
MHRDVRSLASERRYVTTSPQEAAETGVGHWRDVDTCHCGMIVHERNLLVCQDCGTVYGVAQVKTYRSGWSKMQWTVEFDDGLREVAQ